MLLFIEMSGKYKVIKMKNYTRKILLTAVFLFVVVLFIAFLKDSPSSKLEKMGGMLPGIESFDLQMKHISDSDDETLLILGSRDGEILEIEITENVDDESANKYKKRQNLTFEGLFNPRLPPYPEFLTRETGCQDKFKPILQKNEHGEYYILYAGGRLGYGICSDDLIEYRSSLGIFYCPSIQNLFEIRYFTDKNTNDTSIEEFIAAFKCVDN